MNTIYHCAAFCGWNGTEPAAVFGMHDEHLRDECPRCGSDVATGLTCQTCGLAVATEGFDDCMHCVVAVLLVEDPRAIDDLRRMHAGTDWLRTFEREWERQASALVAA